MRLAGFKQGKEIDYMSAAIQLVNQPLLNAGAVAANLPVTSNPVGNPVGTLVGNLVEGHFPNTSRFEVSPEQRLRRAIEYIAELQTEIRSLREELTRSERVSANYETLLRNAMVREQELRSQLASGRF